jgi:hypothetical protein
MPIAGSFVSSFGLISTHKHENGKGNRIRGKDLLKAEILLLMIYPFTLPGNWCSLVS